MSSMFYSNSSFNQNLGAWNVENVTDMTGMFSGAHLSTYNYDQTLIGWNAQNLQSAVPFNAGSSYFCLAESEHQNMIDSDGWIIADSGKSCDDCSAPQTTWDGASWSNGTPNDLKPITLSGDYNTSTDGNFKACNCTIEAGVTLRVNANDYAVINDLDNNGSLIVDDTGSFVQESETATVSDTGYYRMDRETTDYAEYDYTYWSSPSAEETIGDVFTNNSTLVAGADDVNAIQDHDYSEANRIYWLNTAEFNDANNDTFDDEYDDWVNASSATLMTPGKGFIALGAGADIPFDNNFAVGLKQYVFFEGKFNTGTISYNVVEDNLDSDGFTNQNLIGNPYPSAIDINKFYAENSSVLQGTFYFWTHDSPVSGGNPGPDAFNFTNNDYATATSDGTLFSTISNGTDNTTAPQYIAYGQGFIVNVSNAGTITFNNKMRVTTPNTAFKSFHPETIENKGDLQLDRVWLNMTNETGIFRQILVNFYENGHEFYEDGLDGQRMDNGNDNDFFSIIENDSRRFAIQTQSSFEIDRLVPLGVEIIEAGSYKFSIDHFRGVFETGQQVYIQDNKEGVIHNLSTSDYEFYSPITTDNRTRLVLRFTDNTTGFNGVAYHAIGLYPNPTNTEFTISWEPSETIVFEITDLLGKSLLNKQCIHNETGSFTLDISGAASGVYLIRIDYKGTSLVKKLIVE